MTVTFQNNPVSISGSFPKVGDRLPSFTLCGADLNDLSNEDFKEKDCNEHFPQYRHSGLF